MKAINYKFSGETTDFSNYDPTKLVIGKQMMRYVGNADENENFVGPVKPDIIRVPTPLMYPSVVEFSEEIDWVFFIQNTTASPRRIYLYNFNKSNSTYSIVGYINMNVIGSGTFTTRGFRVVNNNYSNGTVSATGTSVVGSGTNWQSDGMCVGNRIGFGSKIPSEIDTWYQISQINSDTGITLTTSLPNSVTDVDYVIQDLRAVVSTSSSTVAQGGIFLIKGLRPEVFTSGGTTIPASTTVDNIQATYKLRDSSSMFNRNSCGVDVDEMLDWNTQLAYSVDRATSPERAGLYVYNIRQPLTLSGGIDDTTLVKKTEYENCLTLAQTNSVRVFTVNHGYASGDKSIYFASTTRLNRASISNIKETGRWISDNMLENPPGGSLTYGIVNINNFTYCKEIDRIIMGGGIRCYMSKYDTTGTQFESMFVSDYRMRNDGTTSNHPPIIPNSINTSLNVEYLNGYLHLNRFTTTTTLGNCYSIPVMANQDFALDNNHFIITPRISITNSIKMDRIVPQIVRTIGNIPSHNISLEPFRMFYRIEGISNNTGKWLRVSDDGDLSNVRGGEVQFAFIFKTIGAVMVPARLKGILITYEDSSSDEHYQPSSKNTDVSQFIFSWRQSKLWDFPIPNLRILFYNTRSNSIIQEDTIENSQLGIWEYSTNDGTSWLPWSSSADSIGNLIRYRCQSIPLGFNLRVILKDI
jgi:hypothetical protein